MNTIALAIALLYLLLVLGLCTWLLIHGVTHSFVGLFAAGAFFEVIPRFGYLALQQAPGGFGANMRFFPLLALFGIAGTLCFAAAFVSLTKFLLRPASRG